MAGRSRQSNGEAIVDLIARLPWWVCVALAFASWIAFHFIASRPLPTVTEVGQIRPGFFLGAWMRGISSALQFVAPGLCVIAAIVSLLRGRTRASLLANATTSRSADALHAMSWQEFEQLVGEAFRLQGYQVMEAGGAQPDGGVDAVLRKGAESFLVQCKQWRAAKVGVDVVRELYGVMAARGAAGGFVVTSGRFTEDAMAFAAGRNVRLVDGSKLFRLLQQAKASLSRSNAPSHPPVQARPSTSLPSCPKCDAPMVRRTAKKGDNAGREFWGCSSFPRCNGTRA